MAFYSIKWKLFFLTITVVVLSSCQENVPENPIQVARNYCTCVETQMNNNKDSLIDVYDCESTFEDSRLMQIKMTFDSDPVLASNKYEKSTLDSAKKFFFEVMFIRDTMCFMKFDSKRIKRPSRVRLW